MRNSNKATAIIRFSALGDVAMTLPSVYDVARRYADQKFVFVTRPPMHRIAVAPPENLTIVAADLKGRHQGPLGMIRLLNDLRRMGVTQIVDLHNVIRSRILTVAARMLGLKVTTLDKRRADRRAIISHRRPLTDPLTPMTERYGETLRRAGFETARTPHATVITTPDSEVENVFEALPSSAKLIIGVAPGAKHPQKMYPSDLMFEVLKELAAEPEVHILMFGGAEDEELLGRWERELKGSATSLASKKLGFAREIAIMSRLRAMLTMDSGNMHLASLVATPVVSIWGGTHPAMGFLGYGQSEIGDVVQDDTLTCRPCSVFGDKPCARGDLACMRRIDPHRVAMAVKRYL